MASLLRRSLEPLWTWVKNGTRLDRRADPRHKRRANNHLHPSSPAVHLWKAGGRLAGVRAIIAAVILAAVLAQVPQARAQTLPAPERAGAGRRHQGGTALCDEGGGRHLARHQHRSLAAHRQPDPPALPVSGDHAEGSDRRRRRGLSGCGGGRADCYRARGTASSISLSPSTAPASALRWPRRRVSPGGRSSATCFPSVFSALSQCYSPSRLLSASCSGSSSAGTTSILAPIGEVWVQVSGGRRWR